MFLLKKGHQPGVYVPLRALFLVVLKFSRSLYFGNHLSESIHTWTIGT